MVQAAINDSFYVRIYKVYLDARRHDALYTYVNVSCSGGQTTQQRAPLQQSEAKRARTPVSNPAGFTRTRIFVLRSVGLRVALTLESAVASSGRGGGPPAPAPGPANPKMETNPPPSPLSSVRARLPALARPPEII